MPSKKLYILYLISMIFGISLFYSIYVSFKKDNFSQVKIEMPEEYKSLKTILERLAKYNYLGNETIYFSINSGNYANWLAEEIDICDQGDCTFFKGLNPFKKQLGEKQHEKNEIVRQSYLLGNIEASASPNNNIFISRASFKVIDKRKDVLAFIVAHELSHILDDSSFVNSLQESKEGFNLNKKKRELLYYEISRNSEMDADKKACLILFNANYPLKTCTESIKFVYKESGDGQETKKDSTHPGFIERIDSIDQYEKDLSIKMKNEQTFDIGSISYDPEMNFIKYEPKKIEG